MEDYFDSPQNALHHLRGVAGYNAREGKYEPWDGHCHEFEQFTQIRLDHAGLTDADVAAWAERLRFPNLKVVSFAFNDLTLACVVDLKKIQLQSPRLTQFLLPPNILVALIQASAVKKAEERANNQ